MTREEYKKHLEGTTAKDLKPLYKKVFGIPPASAKKKSDLVTELHKKFCEINPEDPVVAEEVEQEEVKVEVKTPSRRSLIIGAIKLHIWDRNTLAEYLHMVNPAWSINKNKAAISGTLADLRANKGWTCKVADDGRISVDPS